MKLNLFGAALFAAALTVAPAVAPAKASAVTLFDGLTEYTGLTWNSMDDNSIDGPSFNQHIAALEPYVRQQAYKLPTAFDGGATGMTLEATLFMEVTAYSSLNELLLCGGSCSTFIAAGNQPGDTVTTTLSSAPSPASYSFTLASPGYNWSSAGGNVDGLDHFVAYVIDNPGTVTINNTGRSDGAPVTLSVLAGDLLIGVEDLMGPLTGGSDRDFNDLFFVIRQQHTEVPEPATLSLLALGALGARRLRRKTAAKKQLAA